MEPKVDLKLLDINAPGNKIPDNWYWSSGDYDRDKTLKYLKKNIYKISWIIQKYKKNKQSILIRYNLNDINWWLRDLEYQIKEGSDSKIPTAEHQKEIAESANREIAWLRKNLKEFNETEVEKYNYEANYTVQKLKKLGFSCVHITNAFHGFTLEGACLNLAHDILIHCNPDQINELISDLDRINLDFHKLKIKKFNLCCTLLKDGQQGELVLTTGVLGPIGIILDTGYIYESYEGDSDSSDHIGEKSSYRHGTPFSRKHLSEILNAEYKMNEVLVKEWTAGGILVTTQLHSEDLELIKTLSDTLSFRHYFNGHYPYRHVKIGRKYIEKTFPIFMYDPKTYKITKFYSPTRDRKHRTPFPRKAEFYQKRYDDNSLLLMKGG